MKGRLQGLEPKALLHHLMEEGGLRQVDLVDCFGSQSVVSAVMAGRLGIPAKVNAHSDGKMNSIPGRR